MFRDNAKPLQKNKSHIYRLTNRVTSAFVAGTIDLELRPATFILNMSNTVNVTAQGFVQGEKR